MIDPSWVDKLRPLVDRDLTLRNVFIEKGTLNDAYHHELEKVHTENAQKLKALIQKLGFPVTSNAGDEGVRLSWFIINHAISIPEFMRECLLQIRLAAADHDYPLDLMAYLEDRVSYLEGRPQLYGTHMEWFDGELKLTPIDDPQHLNSRRKSLGLPPVSHDLSSSGMGKPPKDPVKRASEFQKWLLKVGWRS